MEEKERRPRRTAVVVPAFTPEREPVRRFVLAQRVVVNNDDGLFTGVIVEVVPAGKRPAIRVDENVIRDHESYVVHAARRVFGEKAKKEQVLWPRVADVLEEIVQ